MFTFTHAGLQPSKRKGWLFFPTNRFQIGKRTNDILWYMIAHSHDDDYYMFLMMILMMLIPMMLILMMLILMMILTMMMNMMNMMILMMT